MSARPILPLPSKFAALPFQHDQSPDRSGQPPGPNRPTYAKRGKITIVACVPCRRRKTKVDIHSTVPLVPDALQQRTLTQRRGSAMAKDQPARSV
jgi:hypothetical protein